MDQLELSITSGPALRDKGTERVIEHNEDWHSMYARFFYTIWLPVVSPNREFMAEEVRADAAEFGIPEPAHPNAWGAAFLGFVRSGRITRTGCIRNAKDPKSHACLCPTYRKCS